MFIFLKTYVKINVISLYEYEHKNAIIREIFYEIHTGKLRSICYIVLLVSFVDAGGNDKIIIIIRLHAPFVCLKYTNCNNRLRNDAVLKDFYHKIF